MNTVDPYGRYGGGWLQDILGKLDVEKKLKIINAALGEFSKNGYENGSTNAIVKEAGIAKGLLFHYFKSKQGLYEYLQDFCFVTILDAIKERTDWNNTDLITRVVEIAGIKLDIIKEFPEMFNYFKLISESIKTVEDAKALIEKYDASIYDKVYTENIDFSYLKENLDKELTFKTIIWSIEKFSESNLDSFRSNMNDDGIENIMDSIVDYSNFLRKVFYKEGNDDKS